MKSHRIGFVDEFDDTSACYEFGCRNCSDKKSRQQHLKHNNCKYTNPLLTLKVLSRVEKSSEHSCFLFHDFYRAPCSIIFIMLLELWVNIVVVFKIVLAPGNYVDMNMGDGLTRFWPVLNRNRRRVSFGGIIRGQSDVFTFCWLMTTSWPSFFEPKTQENREKLIPLPVKSIFDNFLDFLSDLKKIRNLVQSQIFKKRHHSYRRNENMPGQNWLQVDKSEAFRGLVENATWRWARQPV